MDYSKCLKCEHLGNRCTGPNLALFCDIAVLRKYHKALRKARGILMRDIYEAAYPVSDSVINDYFSADERDFKWTSVAYICRAMLSLCGDLPDNPSLRCIVTAEAIEAECKAMEGRCSELQDQLAAAKEEARTNAASVKADSRRSIDYLKEQVAELKRDNTALRRALIVFGALAAALTIALIVYVVWDVAHPLTGFIRY